MKKFCRLSIIFFLSLSSAFAQNRIFKDLSYINKGKVVNDSLQRLSLVIPSSTKDAPLLIWIGGGAWSYVNHNQELGIAQQFASEGIAVASIGHRLSPATWQDPKRDQGVQHPAHVEDIAAAVKWLYMHAADYGFSREKFFIGGFSSGGHLAALIDLNDKYIKAQDLPEDIFKGIIPISGAYDIANYHEVFKNGSQPELAELHVEAVFGNTQEAFAEASPMTFLDNLSTPLLIMSDGTVDQYTKYFVTALLKTDFKDFDVIYANELTHTDLWKNLAKPDSKYRKPIIRFIQKELNKL
ncbi:alpha/beta hydrolase fold domain-containing protein [Roseivirga sp.]|uniref:alpha/beta hydrolase fold domain-containing protein n=1 Tax=Roseivirga sp. TaxID=1964215 RepID=UPI003B8C8772